MAVAGFSRFSIPATFATAIATSCGPQGNAVSALTEYSVGILLHKDIERITSKFPNLGLALSRETMIEASIFRESNIGQRLRSNASHICSCEQTVRLEAVGITGGAIPLT